MSEERTVEYSYRVPRIQLDGGVDYARYRDYIHEIVNRSFAEGLVRALEESGPAVVRMGLIEERDNYREDPFDYVTFSRRARVFPLPRPRSGLSGGEYMIADPRWFGDASSQA